LQKVVDDGSVERSMAVGSNYLDADVDIDEDED
jgi:hypothetical protein